MLTSNGVDVLGSILWLVAITGAGFLASWFFTVRLALSRPTYIGLLAVVTGLLTAGYLWWAGIGIEFWTNNWLWGIIGALVVSGLLMLVLRRMPAGAARTSAIGVSEVGWDGIVYGSAEALLLSTLPVLVVWQAFGQTVVVWATATLALTASLAVIVIHHLGYPAFRSKRIFQAILGCFPLSIAFAITGSPIAPMAAHAILHLAMLRKGWELPPEERDTMRARNSHRLVTG